MGAPQISNSIVALTPQELDVLNRLIAAGDRAGFYMAYYEMTGSAEAALQAKISTFSESEGGFAYAANWLLTQTLGANGIISSGTYPGIYFLSQKVAESAFNAIQDMVTNGGSGKLSPLR